MLLRLNGHGDFINREDTESVFIKTEAFNAKAVPDLKKHSRVRFSSMHRGESSGLQIAWGQAGWDTQRQHRNAHLPAKLNQSIGLTLTDMVCALFPSLANDVGPGSGNPLLVDSLYSAQFQLNSQSVPGPYYTVLYPQQFNHFQASLRQGLHGALQGVASGDAVDLNALVV